MRNARGPAGVFEIVQLQHYYTHMDPNLHQKKGIEHLNKVLQYAPMVAANGKATVHLTYEDWHVVADTLFRMNTPREILPPAIKGFRLGQQHRSIELDTSALLISIEMF